MEQCPRCLVVGTKYHICETWREPVRKPVEEQDPDFEDAVRILEDNS